MCLSLLTDHSEGKGASPLTDGDLHKYPTRRPHSATILGWRFGRQSLQTPPCLLLRRQAMRPRWRETPFSQKRLQAKNNVVPVELWSSVPVLSQAPPEDVSPGVRPGRAHPGPWLQRSRSCPPQKFRPTSLTQRFPNLERRNTLPLLDTVHSMNPTAITPLSRLRRIIPETRQHLLQKGPGKLPRHGVQTHRP